MVDKPALLTERWKTEDGQRRLKAIVVALRDGKDWTPILQGFPFANEYTVRDGRDLRYANLPGCDLHKADLQGIHAEKLCLRGANLSGARLVGADLNFADLAGANLSASDISRANLFWANLAEANLSECTAAVTGLEEADLAMAILRKANLEGSKFILAKAIGADFTEAVMVAADFSSAVFREANMHAADLRRANFGDADLSWVRFDRANLTEVNLSTACDYHADYEGASVDGLLRPPLTEASDVFSVSCDPFPVEGCGDRGRPVGHAECALSINYVAEHVGRQRCPCGGPYEIEEHGVSCGSGFYAKRCYDRVHCRCLQCGRKHHFVYDVTRIWERYGRAPHGATEESEGADAEGDPRRFL